jgi:hypothetical protein
LPGVALKLFLQAKLNLSIHHHPGVKGPQAGDLLADGTNVVLHRARLDRVTAGGELATADMFSEDLKEPDGIREINEVGVVNLEGVKEACPD